MNLESRLELFEVGVDLFHQAPISFAPASISFNPASISFAQASFSSTAISIDVDAIPFVIVRFPFDSRLQHMASEVIEEIDASKGEIDAFISMCSACIKEHASVKDEPARLSGKPAEAKGIDRRTTGMEAAGKEIDAEIPVMHDGTKGLPSKSIDERSRLKWMRHDRTDEIGGSFGFLSAPTCFTARRKELDVGPDDFQADSIGMADEAKSFAAWGRGIEFNVTLRL